MRVLLIAFLVAAVAACDGSGGGSSNKSAHSADTNPRLGCLDTYASNFDSEATHSDSSCIYPSVACDSTDYILETGQGYINNEVLNLPPGSVIGIRGGERGAISIINLQGTAEAPFVFTNCDGKAVINQSDTGDSIRIQNSRHLKITGTGSASDSYGIEISNGSQGVHGYEKTSDLEVDHLEISNVEVGVWVVNRPTCDGSTNQGTFTQYNTLVHHNYIHNVGAEGTYIGGSWWHDSYGYKDGDCPGQALPQPDLIVAKIHNNLVEHTGRDGIQLGGAIEGAEIYNNIVKDYGTADLGPHKAGIMINPGTTASIFSNRIEDGAGTGMHVLGFNNLIYSNLFVDLSNNQDAILVGDRSPLANSSYTIVNNSFINLSGKAVNINSSASVDNTIYNNLLVNVPENPIYSVSDNTVSFNNYTAGAVTDLGFEAPGTYDFTPAADSPLLDMGETIDSNKVFADHYMRPRIAGTAVDIGAFERPE